jgi:acetylornithine deacetylase
MDVFALTRALIDIESITNNEEAVGNFLFDILTPLASRYGGRVERVEVEPRRFNVFAQWGDELDVTLSTHMDTVPPFIASREDDEYIWGRGACDTKGIIACMIYAVEALLIDGRPQYRPAFRGRRGAQQRRRLPRRQDPRGSRYIINGEPTENRLALGSKGVLRYEVCATGKMAHSAYPELGDSAIHKLIDALADIRRIPLPVDDLLGPSTLNIGRSPAAARPT